MDRELQKLRDQGVDNEHGVVLWDDVPSAAFRFHYKKKTQRDVIGKVLPKSRVPTIVLQDRIISHGSGWYRFRADRTEEDSFWPDTIEVSDETPASEMEFIDSLRNLKHPGPQTDAIPGRTVGIRHTLGITGWLEIESDTVFREACHLSNVDILSQTFLVTSSKCSPDIIKTPLMNTMTFVYHHRGHARKWIVVAPKYKQEFEKMVFNVFGKSICPGEGGGHIVGETKPCTQQIEHMRLWIQPFLLEEWQIPHAEVTQTGNQLMILFPGCYYWGYSSGFSVIETRSYGGPWWSPDGFVACNRKHPLCDSVKGPINDAAMTLFGLKLHLPPEKATKSTKKRKSKQRSDEHPVAKDTAADSTNMSSLAASTEPADSVIIDSLSVASTQPLQSEDTKKRRKVQQPRGLKLEKGSQVETSEAKADVDPGVIIVTSDSDWAFVAADREVLAAWCV